jgi:hypothetical protein
VSRIVLCLLVVLGVGSSVVAWEDRVEATVAPAEMVAQVSQVSRIDERAPAPARIAGAERAPRVAAPTPTLATPAPALAQPPLSLAPKTSPPRC